jgi:hypothetical protein
VVSVDLVKKLKNDTGTEPINGGNLALPPQAPPQRRLRRRAGLAISPAAAVDLVFWGSRFLAGAAFSF